jgi:AraC family transcriptional regulator
MLKRYQDIYPEKPLQSSTSLRHTSVADMLTLEYFEAEPGEMPYEVFDQHHILINLRKEPHRVENWRDGEHRDFTYHKNEIIVTPAGVKSGWKWHTKSKVIVITLKPKKLETFAQSELGMLLTDVQLKNIPQFTDEDITQVGMMLFDALNSQIGSAVIFECLARVFLIKLIQKYGLERHEDILFSKRFPSKNYKRVFDYVAENYSKPINLENMAKQAGLSTSHFARLFKEVIGKSPYQFVMSYRVEQAKKKLRDDSHSIIDVSLSSGFADQAHFSRVFKQIEGQTPKAWRDAQ